MAKYKAGQEQIHIGDWDGNRPDYITQPSVMSSQSRASQKKFSISTISKSMKKGIADFFGIGEDNPCERANWTNRRINMANRKHGSVKRDFYKSTDTLDSVFERSGGPVTPHIRDPLKRPKFDRTDSAVQRQLSTSSYKRTLRSQPQKKAHKDSVARMAWDGVSSLVGSTPKSKRKPHMHSRSFAPSSMSSVCDEEVDDIDEVFFDIATPTSPMVQPFSSGPFASTLPTLPTIQEKAPLPQAKTAPNLQASVSPMDVDASGRPIRSGWKMGPSSISKSPTPPTPRAEYDATDGLTVGFGRIAMNITDKVFDNSDRRQMGMGFMGQLCRRDFKKKISKDVRKQLEEMDDHRPFFTYWVTFVQIVVYIVAVAVYGIAPIGFEETQISQEVLKPNLAIEQDSYFEKDNFWIGPRQADLIHLGAKYSPCMRDDQNVQEAIYKDKVLENNTACCIRNDGAGCVQTQRKHCSKTLSTWQKWTADNRGPQNKVSGSVCGQDPKFCTNPASVKPHEWVDDITQWPICKESQNASDAEETRHVSCEVVGRPCCIGIHGQCIITTREHCKFLRGYFHEEAALCSQVKCMNEICGMIQFLYPDKPDQFYRLWTSLFLHAGFVQLVITVLFQFFVMRDIEKLAGWLRIAIIYLGSGMAGSLASAVFLPYHVEAGPSGSQFGLLACLFVEVIQSWQLLARPWRAIGKLTLITVILFIVGLMPMVDNYAHLVGFVFGFLLSFAFLPYVTFGQFDRRRKIISIVISLLASIGLCALLIILFYVSPVYECPFCHYFNCIPFTNKFCKSMEVKITRDAKYY